MKVYRKISITKIENPQSDEINEELQWLGISLGLFNLRDKDKSCFRIFIEFIKSSKDQDGLSSDEIAHQLRLSRGTVIHHIHKLEESGLVLHKDNRYVLRVSNLQKLIESVEEDVNKTMDDMKKMAKHLDKRLGL